jgi:hypothetical protein
MGRQANNRPISQQIGKLKSVFPDAQITWRGGALTWIGQLQPTPASETYTVKMVYRLGRRAVVAVLDPPLEALEGRRLPHVFPGDELCLHHTHEWDGTLVLADTILPWASEWLLFYEFWKATAEWLGGGHEPPIKQPSHPGTTASEHPQWPESDH